MFISLVFSAPLLVNTIIIVVCMCSFIWMLSLNW